MEYGTIELDGSLKAHLDWAEAKEKAASFIEKNQSILWKLNLGLFDKLIHPFSHRSQFLSLCLSLDHFKKDVWPYFSKNSLGILIYSGSADYRNVFPWDDEQRGNLLEWLKSAFQTSDEFEHETGKIFDKIEEATPETLNKDRRGARLLSFFCRDACVDYLNLLAANIPDEIPIYVELDTSSINDQAFRVQLTSQEKYERLHFMPEKHEQGEVRTAICLPPCRCLQIEIAEQLNKALNYLIAHKIPYKIIPEATLITDWDGLDQLICCPGGVDSIGRRKLQGFCAAGGQIITMGTSIGLPHEASFDEWTKSKL